MSGALRLTLTTLCLLLLGGCFSNLPQQDANQEQAAGASAPTDDLLGAPSSSVLLLGTFDLAHALKANSGAAAELNEVVERLLAFRPTKVAVALPVGEQAELDRRYSEFMKGAIKPQPTALDRIAMTVAAESKQTRLWAIGVSANSDAATNRSHEARGLADATGQSALLESEIVERYDRWFARQKKLQLTESIRNNLVWMNSPRHLLNLHGRELVGEFDIGDAAISTEEGNYAGADAVTDWYNMHLRIFANLQRIAARDGERILVVLDLRHVPLLRHAVDASPRFSLAEVDEILGVPSGAQRRIVPLL